jgi:hypothetical protein
MVFRPGDEVETTSTTTQRGGGSPQEPPVPPLAIGIGAFVLVVAFLVFFLLPRGEAEPIKPTPVPVQPTAVSTPVPVVSPIATYVDICEQHISRGRYQDCVNTAEAGLEQPNLSEADRRVLVGYIVSSGMKDLYTQPFQPLDRKQHQQMVDTYLSLVKRAQDAGVAIDSPLQVASYAHASSHFQLARVAIEQAYQQGQFDPSIDRDVTGLYVSVLHGIGHYYTQSEWGSPLFEEGLQALVASDYIADDYQTGRSEAEVLLNKLIGSDWPQPMDSPLIQ